MVALQCPLEVLFIRHAPSNYNAHREKKRLDEMYTALCRAYARNPESAETLELARVVHEKYPLLLSDPETGLAEVAYALAKSTGQRLSATCRTVPDVIFVSPYIRTVQTLSALTEGWPELASCEVIEEWLIREREHGDRLKYNDRRLYFAHHPEERVKYDLQGPYRYRYPGGESFPDVMDRSQLFLDRLNTSYPGARIMVVTHHLFILATRAVLEDLSLEEIDRIDHENKPANCGITSYRGTPSGKLLLTRYNERLY